MSLGILSQHLTQYLVHSDYPMSIFKINNEKLLRTESIGLLFIRYMIAMKYTWIELKMELLMPYMN